MLYGWNSPIRYPLVDPRTSAVCLITKDPQREYKDLLEEAGVRFINRVVGIEKLKGKFKSFEARRALLRENALFLADERVIPLLPRLLGKMFFTAKKFVSFRSAVNCVKLTAGPGLMICCVQAAHPCLPQAQGPQRRTRARHFFHLHAPKPRDLHVRASQYTHL